MISITSKGDYRKTRNFFDRIHLGHHFDDLNKYGQMGVDALSKATPIDSALTSQSWEYRIIRNRGWTGIEWFNTNDVNGTPIAILLQYGHATGTGGYVLGRDYINPAIRPIFDQIAENVWKKVIS